MKTSQLSLPEPCTVGWSSMLPTENGQYCTSCSKVIPELHRMTDAAILEQFMQRSGDFCGRIAPIQIQRIRFDESALRAQVQVKQVQDSLLRRIIGGGLLALTFTTWNVAYAEKLPVAPTMIDQFMLDQPILTEPKDSLQHVVIRGVVRDQVTKEPVSFAVIYVEISGRKFACQSDLDGHFQLHISGKYPVNSEVNMVAKSIDYQTKTIPLKLKSESIRQDIEMELDEAVLIEGIIIHQED